MPTSGRSTSFERLWKVIDRRTEGHDVHAVGSVVSSPQTDAGSNQFGPW
ncbi:hypothetical protein AB4851_23055 [Burkholderia sp. 22PA0099]